MIKGKEEKLKKKKKKRKKTDSGNEIRSFYWIIF